MASVVAIRDLEAHIRMSVLHYGLLSGGVAEYAYRLTVGQDIVAFPPHIQLDCAANVVQLSVLLCMPLCLLLFLFFSPLSLQPSTPWDGS